MLKPNKCIKSSAKEEIIAKVHKMLKPGGIFVTSTACIGDTMMRFLKFIVPIGKFFGLMPQVMVFTTKELEDSLTDAVLRLTTNGNRAKAKQCLLWRRRLNRSD